MTVGCVVSLQVSPGTRAPLEKLGEARFVAGYGIDGDRHATDRADRQGYQVLLMDRETLEELGLEPGVIREQVTTSGIEASSLRPGQEVALGEEVVVRVSRPATPCSRMDEIRPGLQDKLAGRRGQLASIVSGGTVRVGDTARVVEAAS